MAPRSSDDIGLIRNAFALFEGGRLDELFELADAEIQVESAVADRSLRGRAEARAALDRWLGEAKRWRALDVRFLLLADRVLATGHVETESSLGSPITLPIAWLFTVGEGKVVRVEMFANERHAQRAVEAGCADSA